MVFLFQMLGVVNLQWFVKQRLIIFIFGSEDGDLALLEQSRSEVWISLLARNVFAYYPFWKAVVIMLAFDDYDFQHLVLDDSNSNAVVGHHHLHDNASPRTLAPPTIAQGKAGEATAELRRRVVESEPHMAAADLEVAASGPVLSVRVRQQLEEINATTKRLRDLYVAKI
eukprot:NODE_13194_length_1179_cov_13.550380.p1 GENE.NODE_13194_length_1179_cov_13.550380~~NODE_13194_length_1179_cov_13.550380.p1  ORF type:complete len:170 (-),score=58.47 NODE_13194_length_1179_cov_13.550380:280-789(-)